jgi:5-methylcytosine-specific restriction protein A
MALSPQRKCTKAGCRALTRTGRCERHAKEKANYDQHRPNSYQRGYDKRWSAFRAAYLAEHPLCEDCLTRNRTRAATDLHHIEKLADNPSRKLDKSNVMPLCASCHARRTARGE